MGRKPKRNIPDFMDSLTDSFLSGEHQDVVDVVTFTESPWGLNFTLFPVQKFILKCVSEDTLIVDDWGALVTMKEYYEGKNTLVTTYNEKSKKLEITRANAVLETGKKEVFKVTLKGTRREVELTSDHRVLTSSGYKEVKDLSLEDRIVISSREPFGEPKSSLMEDEALLLGMMTGDGSCSGSNVALVVANGQDETEAEFRRICSDKMTEVNFRVKQSPGCRLVSAARPKGWDRNTKSTIGNLLLDNGILGKTCHEKVVPKSVFGARKEVVAAYLRGLFATDGGAGKTGDGQWINLTSCCKPLVDGVSCLLRRFGVRSTLSHLTNNTNFGKQNAWQIKITAACEINLFFQEIGIPPTWKDRYFEFWKKLGENKRTYSHLDSLPVEVRDEAILSRQNFFDSGGKIRRCDDGSVRAQVTGKNALRSFACFVGDDELASTSNSDICWDRVLKIESVGEKTVYDISVPQTHNFVVNGVVVHNCAYGLPLDSETRNIEIPDVTNEKMLYTFTEEEFLQFLYDEGRCNVSHIPVGQECKELVLVVGRRGSKCRSTDDYIATTEGTMTFGELLARKQADESIGIVTYDPVTYKQRITKDFSIWDNGERECGKITTCFGYSELSSYNHPYLVWRDDWDEPRFVELSEVRLGDRIAISSRTIFGRERIGEDKAKILGYLMGDGGLTSGGVCFTNLDPRCVDDFTSLISRVFGYHVKKKGSGITYDVVKPTGRFLHNGSQKNVVKEWLVEEGVFEVLSKNKRVPKSIMRSVEEDVAAFLSCLFACDGWASMEGFITKGHNKEKAFIGLSSASSGLISDVQHLLLKFGIRSIIYPYKAKCEGKEFDAYKLLIESAEDVLLFCRKIGIFSKGEKLKLVEDLAKTKESRSSIYSLPKGIWNRIKRIKNEKELSNADIVGSYGVGVNSRLRFDSAPLRRKVKSYANLDSTTYNMADSDILWDTVKSVVPSGLHSTVDLCVEGTHIIGGDIVSHNSTVAAIIADYEVYKLIKRGDPAKYYGQPSGSPIDIICAAPTDEQAHAVFDRTLEGAAGCLYLRDRILNQTQEYFNIMTDFDMKSKKRRKTAAVTLRAGGCSSNALRGKNSIVVIMDEMAFFIDNGGRFSGDAVYRALTPSTASFMNSKNHGEGKVVCISSPYAKYGKFYERYVESFNETDTTLMFKMYSSMLNPRVDPVLLKTERRRNRINFYCEYGGDFSDSVTAWIDEEEPFRACIVDKESKDKGESGVQYFMGIDIAAKNDGTAIAIVHREQKTRKIILDYADVWFTGESDVWEFEESIYRGCDKYRENEYMKIEDIANEVKELSRWWPIRDGWFDQWSGHALLEKLHGLNLKVFRTEHISDNFASDIYTLLKSLYLEGLIELYNHPVLVPELLGLEAEKKNKHKVIVRAPNKRGTHDDISDAFARAVWACFNWDKDRQPNITNLAGGSSSARDYQQSAAQYIAAKKQMHGVQLRGAMVKAQKKQRSAIGVRRG